MALGLLVVAAVAVSGATTPCVGALSDDGRRMYDVVAPAVRADSDIEAVMRRRLKHMVMAGDLDRYTARANGAAVAACLAEVKSSQSASLER